MIRLWRALCLTAMLTGIVLGMTVFAVPGRGPLPPTASLAAASTQCPPETNSCVTVPLPCDGTTCTATVGPVTNLGDDQSVYVEISGLPSGDEAALGFCSISQGTSPVPVVADPNCASSIPPAPGCVPTGTATACPNTASPSEWQYAASETGPFTISIGTEEDPESYGSGPIVSQNSTQFANSTYGSFYCDDTSAFCGIEISDIPAADALTDVVEDGAPPRSTFTVSSQNTIIVPVSWAAGSTGCGSAPFLEVDTAYSSQQFLTAAGEATCTEPTGVAVLPTALASVDSSGCVAGTGTSCPISDVAQGTVPVTFTDDPEAPSTLAELKKEVKKLGGGFAYIPITVSATEIAFDGLAGRYPVDTYDLTPAMVAGVMTQLWNNPTAQPGDPDDNLCGQFTAGVSGVDACVESMQTGPADVVVAGGNGKFKTVKLTYFQYLGHDNYSKSEPADKDFAGDTAYALLNSWPTTGKEANLGAMFPSTASGASYEATSWMCSAPTTPYTLDVNSQQVSVQDIMTAPQILTDAEKGPFEATKDSSGQYQANSFVTQAFLLDPSQCQAESTIPDDFASTTATIADLYEPSSQPLTAAHAMTGAATSYGNGGVAFGTMDSSQADFYGLLPASLQNAAGQFVAPDQASIDAALNDAKTNKDGTLTPDYDNAGDSAAYPMPMVTYALVSTAPQPTADQAQQLTDLLTNLVSYSCDPSTYSTPLPAGYVPMPANMCSQATADIAKDIVGPSGSGTGGTTGGTPGSTSTPTTSTPTTSTPTTASPASTTPSVTVPAANAVVNTLPSPVRHIAEALGVPLLLTLGGERYVLPGLVLVAILCLIGGPLLYLAPSLRRRLESADRDADDSGRHSSSEPEEKG